MNLFEWKQEKLETFREQLKGQIREGFDVETHFLFSEDQIAEIKEEIEIEDYSELYEDFEEVSLDEEELEAAGYVHEAFDFSPSADGSVMDIEIEVDTELMEITDSALDKLCELFFAEEAEVEFLEESNRAKIIFKRSKGEVFKKKKCAKGMRLVGNKCLPQQARKNPKNADAVSN